MGIRHKQVVENGMQNDGVLDKRVRMIETLIYKDGVTRSMICNGWMDALIYML